MEELLDGAGSLLRKRRQGEEGREALVCPVFQMQQLWYRQGNTRVFFPQPEVCAPKLSWLPLRPLCGMRGSALRKVICKCRSYPFTAPWLQTLQ